jgi:hypothetical protein
LPFFSGDIDSRIEPCRTPWKNCLHREPSRIPAGIIRTDIEAVSVPDGA